MQIYSSGDQKSKSLTGPNQGVGRGILLEGLGENLIFVSFSF